MNWEREEEGLNTEKEIEVKEARKCQGNGEHQLFGLIVFGCLHGTL